MLYKLLAKPLLFQCDPERAHHLVFGVAGKLQANALFSNLASTLFSSKRTDLTKSINGIPFKNPVGIAAGFDKNGLLVDLLHAAGYGHVEVGSITAKPSAGNPTPRLFRLPSDSALINRMGLNNDGADAICERLAGRKFNGVLGINVAKTHDPSILGDAAIQDYCYSIERALPVADYVTINVSCPNTTEGKTFEDAAALTELLSAVRSLRDFSSKPVYVKLSADLDEASLVHLAGISLDFGIAGFVAVNTSLSRAGLKTTAPELEKIGRGGLSGAPLQQKARNAVSTLRRNFGEGITLISAGGINSPEEGRTRFELGADLVQVYSGMIYEGPGLGGAICKAL